MALQTSTPHASREDPLDVAEAWCREGRRVALATVISTWGSSPLPVGSQLVVDEKGNFLGSVSGGCVEGAVVREALEVIAEGTPRTLKFGVTNDSAWEVGLSCGGEIEIFVESAASNQKLLSRLQELRRSGEPVALVTRLSDGMQAVLHPGGLEGPLYLGDDERSEVLGLVRSDRSATVNGGLFVRVYNRPVRLVLVGAVHIAQALVKLAETLGFEVVIIDPRTSFATDERFPGVTMLADWPDEAMAKVGVDWRTAVITLTHDPKLDDPALIAALTSSAFFIGCLGSRKTHKARLARLREQGVTEEALARLHAPVGLPLGGRRPAEIAVSIVAEIIAAMHEEGESGRNLHRVNAEPSAASSTTP